jgi:ABC-2 type transport system permease protein
LAKFTGSLVFYLLSWTPLVGVLVVLRQVTQQPQLLDSWAMCGVMTGIACIGATFLSIGVFASSLTRSQIIAAMTSLLIGIGLWTLSLRFSQTDSTGDRLGRLLDHLSVTRHMQEFARGVVDGRALVFHLSTTLFFLFLTQRVIESRRWK